VYHAIKTIKGKQFMPRRGKVSKAPEGYYTAKEAIKRLHMPPTTFYYYVKLGKIKKKIPYGHKEGFYEKAFIDKMAEASQLYAIEYAEDPSVFSVATAEDAPGIYDVIVSLWGTLNATTTETRLSWYQVNPEIDYVVKQEGIVVGFVNIRPLTHDAIERLMAGEIQPKDLKPSDILPFTPGVPLECEVGAAVRADVYHPKKYGMRLIAGAIETCKNFARRGIFIKRFYTQSSTPDGIRLCRGLGFEDITPLPNKMPRQFVLDTETSDSPFAQEYRDILKQHTELSPNYVKGAEE
jgi:hypothetical protein